MKKNIKLILALVLTAMMIVGSISALADTPAYDSSVSVTGLAEGDVVHFYKIVEWVGEASGNVKGWKVASPFDFDLTAVLVGYPEVQAVEEQGTPGEEGYVEAVAHQDAKPATGITSMLAGTLAKQAAEATISGYPKNETVAADETSVSLDVSTLGAGIYMALITPADPDMVYNPVFVSSDYNTDSEGNTNTWALTENASYSNSGAAKKSETELTKTADTEETAPDDVKWITTAIGDTVNFTVTTTIPGYGTAYEHPYFKMTDKLTDLKLASSSTVTITSPDAAAAAATITPAEDLLSYTITFTEEYLKTLTVPTQITVTYDAIVTNTAPYNVNREKNEVWTEFSHDVTNESDHAFKKDDTVHYTFTIDADVIAGGEEAQGKKGSEIVKVGRDAAGNPINETTETSTITSSSTWQGPQADAHFKLYRDSRCREEDEYIPKTATGANGTALDITSGTDGRMTISGLDAGEYWLKEFSCPSGFVMDTHVAHIVIETVESEKSVTEYTTNGTTWITAAAYEALPYGTDEEKAAKDAYKSYTYSVKTLDSYTITIDDVKTAEYHFVNQGSEAKIDWTVTPPVELPHQFVNTEGLQLPSTGGIGTTLFYVGGSILVLAAVILLVTKRRMGGND